jgi:hypothetical protein
MGAGEFLSRYRNRILTLSFRETEGENRLILNTLLPLAAALRRREPELRPDETLERTRACAVAGIDRILGTIKT